MVGCSADRVWLCFTLLQPITAACPGTWRDTDKHRRYGWCSYDTDKGLPTAIGYTVTDACGYKNTNCHAHTHSDGSLYLLFTNTGCDPPNQ